ncbi:hypothetical protein CYMTET_39288 [Cymbomonas tetramitiformis]|uniref:Uncharacterized protein n=1 Tax=Cymbomonas tetramitiformis TaxID=36881 RepID=A0AAE0CCG2_9CHLO|nr:hypothetical protein CYMTET_39288 [Cymbomonas tetramitiformis]
MQYYTKQQLQGSHKYTAHTRVGNWNEDTAVDEVKLQEFIRKKDNGELMLDAFAARIHAALNQVPLATAGKSENVQFGDTFQLRSKETEAVVAVDLKDKDPRADFHAYAVTCSHIAHPCPRNTFVLEKFQHGKNHGTTYIAEYSDQFLHYGQIVLLRANPAVEKDTDTPLPLFLTSNIVSLTSFSKVSKNQEVSLTPSTAYDSAWKVLPVKPEHRDVAEGEPVMAGAPVVIRHCHTGQDLCCLGMQQKNDFGTEFEICANTVPTNGKNWKLHKDSTGLHDAQHDVAGSQPNFFCFVTGNLS